MATRHMASSLARCRWRGGLRTDEKARPGAGQLCSWRTSSGTRFRVPGGRFATSPPATGRLQPRRARSSSADRATDQSEHGRIGAPHPPQCRFADLGRRGIGWGWRGSHPKVVTPTYRTTAGSQVGRRRRRGTHPDRYSASWPTSNTSGGRCLRPRASGEENRYVLYDDGRIACDDSRLVVRRYYPWGGSKSKSSLMPRSGR